MVLQSIDGFDNYSGSDINVPYDFASVWRLTDLSKHPAGMKHVGWKMHKPACVGYEVTLNGKLLEWTRLDAPCDQVGDVEIWCETGIITSVWTPCVPGEYGKATINTTGPCHISFNQIPR